MTQQTGVDGGGTVGTRVGGAAGTRSGAGPLLHDSTLSRAGVGPVLRESPFARVVVAAIEEDNDDVRICEEGALIQVQVEDVCRLRRCVVEALVGRPVQFQEELEMVMASFAGRLSVDTDRAIWWRSGRTHEDPLADLPRVQAAQVSLTRVDAPERVDSPTAPIDPGLSSVSVSGGRTAVPG